MRRLSTLTALALLLLATGQAHGQLIPGVTATTNMGTFGSYSLPNLTNGVGLSALNPAATHSTNFTDMWMSNAILTGQIVFDFGATFNLQNAYVWNYNYAPSLTRSTQALSIDTSLDNVTYANMVGSTTIPQGTGLSTLTANTFALSGQARYVRFNILSNYGGGYTGLSEVQFAGTAIAAVPEPSTWLLSALLGTSFAAASWARKVRSSSSRRESGRSAQ